MKKFILSLAVIAAIGFTSCSSDDDNGGSDDGGCQTCDLASVDTEICDNGDGTYDITILGQTTTSDIPDGTSFSDIIDGFEASGYDCN